jgi:hydroxymethylbilane synthase
MSGKPPRTKLTIATRGSKLALWQADYVASLLAQRGVQTEKLVIKTTADRIQDRFLHELGGKGLFVKELEEALVEKHADLAVHSLKDMTASLQAPFVLAAIMKRHSPYDAIIFRPDVVAKSPDRLPRGRDVTAATIAAIRPLTIGTGSLRRQSLLEIAAPGLEVVGIRGNVDTRLAKLHGGAWDAIILAEASLERLGIKDVEARRLAPDWFIPSASQGALAIETRADDELAGWLGAELGCAATTLHVGIERALLARLGGDCNMPFACHVWADEAAGGLRARAGIYAKSGASALAQHAGPAGGAHGEGFLETLTDALARAGAGRILRELGLTVPARFA